MRTAIAIVGAFALGLAVAFASADHARAELIRSYEVQIADVRVDTEINYFDGYRHGARECLADPITPATAKGAR